MFALTRLCGPCAAWGDKTFLRDSATGGVLGELVQQELDRDIMKLFKHTSRFLIAATLLAVPVASFAADEKKTESALMEPIRSVLDHYLMIQTELAKDSLQGVDEHANAIAKAVKGDDMKMLSADVASPVTFGFRNDRRSGDAEIKTVALVECVLRHFETGDCACVDEHVLRPARQRIYSAPHRQ